ncbi:hypothetical protein, partial [Escherichia coli]|uniref:hypothetical protein n=1 Tax=Escherichia coli TaxID=562 RepID=UPI001AA190DE
MLSLRPLLPTSTASNFQTTTDDLPPTAGPWPHRRTRRHWPRLQLLWLQKGWPGNGAGQQKRCQSSQCPPG